MGPVVTGVLGSLAGRDLQVHGERSPEDAASELAAGLVGRRVPVGRRPQQVAGRVVDRDLEVWVKRRGLVNSGTQVYRGRVVGEAGGCRVAGSLRTALYVRVLFAAMFAIALFGAADGWVLTAQRAAAGTVSASVVLASAILTVVPVVIVLFYALMVTVSLRDLPFLTAWLEEGVGRPRGADAPSVD